MKQVEAVTIVGNSVVTVIDNYCWNESKHST